jgi:hypothetical protein
VEDWNLYVLLETSSGENSIGCRHCISSNNTQGTSTPCTIRGEHYVLILSLEYVFAVHGMTTGWMLWYPKSQCTCTYTFCVHMCMCTGYSRLVQSIRPNPIRWKSHTQILQGNECTSCYLLYFVMNSPSVLYDTLETAPPEALKSAHKL